RESGQLGHLGKSPYVKVLISLSFWQGCQGGQISLPGHLGWGLATLATLGVALFVLRPFSWRGGGYTIRVPALMPLTNFANPRMVLCSYPCFRAENGGRDAWR